MASLQDLVRQHTESTPEQARHLRRLTATWSILADLCSSDLLLYLPVARRSDDAASRYVIAGHVRPATAQTLYRDDQVGRFFSAEIRPLVATAATEGVIVSDTVESESGDEPITVRAVPVCFESEVIAVLTTENPESVGREIGDLESIYLEVFETFVQMIHEGTFPFDTDEGAELSARVGDGAIVVDRAGRVRFTSPNAVSALHRMGVHINAIGRSLDDLGFHADVLRSSFSLKVPVTQEIERGTATTIHSRVYPLVEHDVIVGALVLLRDVSDLRRQERLLVSMDATIREIHHRVKNNLQTVSSLLRLQGRRLSSPEAKSAIDQSVRRIRSIALVHEILAQDGGDDVRFDDILHPVTQMVEEALVSPERPVSFVVVGEGPTLPANTASSLAVVLAELLQNAVEHGFPPGTKGGRVTVELESAGAELTIRVHDDGAGLPDGFEPSTSGGLGLTIARTLAAGELGGELTLRPAATGRAGTVAELRARVVDDE